jgi:hypothetical protein
MVDVYRTAAEPDPPCCTCGCAMIWDGHWALWRCLSCRGEEWIAANGICIRWTSESRGTVPKETG